MTDKVKLEGLKVVDKKKPVKEVKEIIYTSPVKIGDKSYIIKPLSMLDVKKLNIERKKLEKGDEIASYDFNFLVLLTVIKKWNPETKDLTVDNFEEMIGLDEFDRIQKAILQITNLKKYFTTGASGK